jgi:signal transduction histidine kinase
VFSVADSGPGIAPEDLGRLFEKFWQRRRADTRGVGLGLAIARGIVEAHGGRIWAESTLGNGSTFYFSLPAVAQRIAQPDTQETAAVALSPAGYEAFSSTMFP